MKPMKTDSGLLPPSAEEEHLSHTLCDIRLWIERHLQSLQHRSGPISLPKPNGYSVAEIPDWEMRQKLANVIKCQDDLNTRAQPQSPWIKVSERLPESQTIVIALYVGVYSPRICLFWLDGGKHPHFGAINEPDGRGSQPATHWMSIPMYPQPPTSEEKI